MIADHFFYGAVLPFYILVWVCFITLCVCAVGIAIEVFEKSIIRSKKVWRGEK